MQHKLFYINEYTILDKTIEVDILPNKYIDELVEINYNDFMDFMELHGHLEGLEEMSLTEIDLNTLVEVEQIIYQYIVSRVLNMDKVINQTESLLKHFGEIFKPFQS
jgi:hypothetical protein